MALLVVDTSVNFRIVVLLSAVKLYDFDCHATLPFSWPVKVSVPDNLGAAPITSYRIFCWLPLYDKVPTSKARV